MIYILILMPYSGKALERQIKIRNHTLKIEIADNESQLQKGLMHRKKLASDQGMLFVFQATSMPCMWMKNTYIPLSVAFINQEGIITNIEKMQPQTKTKHCASSTVRYALEVNQNWFSDRIINPGDQVMGLPSH